MIHSSDYRKIVPYALVILLGFIGFALPLPIFPEIFLNPGNVFLSESYSLSQRTFLLGLLLSCYPFGQLLGSPLLGRISDRKGRKITILLSLMVCFLAYLFIAYAISIASLFGLFLGLFICGFAEGNIAIAQSVIADITSKENKAKYFGFIEIFVCAGFIIGPLMGGILADASYVSWFSFSLPFYAAAFFTLIGFLIILFSSEETRLQKEYAHPSFWESLIALFSVAQLRRYYFANFLIALGFFSFFRFLPVYLQRVFDFSSSELGFVMAYDAFWIAMGVIFLIPFTSKRLSAQKSTAMASLLYAFFLILLLLPNNSWAFAVTIPPLGFCFALSVTYGSVMISDSVNSKIHGQAMGSLQSVQVLAGVVTGILGGFLAQIPSLPLVVGAVMSGACGLLLFQPAATKKH